MPRSGNAPWRKLSRTPARRQPLEAAPPEARLESRPAKPLRIAPERQNAERRSAIFVARRSAAGPTTDFNLRPAALPSLRVARLRALRQRPGGASPDTRLSFRETAFAGAPDAPTPFDRVTISSLEHEER